MSTDKTSLSEIYYTSEVLSYQVFRFRKDEIFMMQNILAMQEQIRVLSDAMMVLEDSLEVGTLDSAVYGSLVQLLSKELASFNAELERMKEAAAA
jgi:hypothetical protein